MLPPAPEEQTAEDAGNNGQVAEQTAEQPAEQTTDNANNNQQATEQSAGNASENEADNEPDNEADNESKRASIRSAIPGIDEDGVEILMDKGGSTPDKVERFRQWYDSTFEGPNAVPNNQEMLGNLMRFLNSHNETSSDPRTAATIFNEIFRGAAQV